MMDSLYNDLAKKIMQYFDRQLNPDDEKEFLTQIKKNPEGHDAFMKEKHIREKLKKNVLRPSGTPALRAQIKEQIKKYPGQ
jgi:galactitol-specific phosphotransferase system IIB component